MSLFKQAENTQCYAKIGIMGLAGSGKTYTATSISLGLIAEMKKRGINQATKPAMFLDTETGSDWISGRFKEDGIALHSAKTRAFRDLLSAVNEAENSGSLLIVDSITHFWRDLTESYQRKKNRRFLQFQDWAVLKAQWGKFTDLFVNSNLHIIICGRAGFEYDHEEDQDGKKELIKSGVKMKAETETGYEPSLLLYMERHHDMRTNTVWREAHVLKDRSHTIDGDSIKNPTFKDFQPHINHLNLGGHQLGVDTERDSTVLFDESGRPDWQKEKEQKGIALDEIKEIMQKHAAGSSAADKLKRGDLMEEHFGTRAWSRIESLDLANVSEGRDKLWKTLEGHDYGYTPPLEIGAPKPDNDFDEELPDFDNPEPADVKDQPLTSFESFADSNDGTEYEEPPETSESDEGTSLYMTAADGTKTYMDKHGRAWDPEKDATKADGTPSYNKDRTFRKRRRDAGTSVSDDTQQMSTVEEVVYDPSQDVDQDPYAKMAENIPESKFETHDCEESLEEASEESTKQMILSSLENCETEEEVDETVSFAKGLNLSDTTRAFISMKVAHYRYQVQKQQKECAS